MINFLILGLFLSVFSLYFLYIDGRENVSLAFLIMAVVCLATQAGFVENCLTARNRDDKK